MESKTGGWRGKKVGLQNKRIGSLFNLFGGNSLWHLWRDSPAGESLKLLGGEKSQGEELSSGNQGENSTAPWQLGAEWEGRGPIPFTPRLSPLTSTPSFPAAGITLSPSSSSPSSASESGASKAGSTSPDEKYSPPDPEAPGASTPAIAERSTRVLIVDDDVDWAEAVVLGLETEGIEALAVHSAKEALHVLQRETFHAAVIDVLMPDRWGVELVFEIRQILGDSLPIIIATGALSADGVAAGLLAGADDELFKVDARAELIPKLRRLWGRAGREEQGGG